MARKLADRQILDRYLIAVQNLPTTGTNVYEDDPYAVPDGKIPCVVIEPADQRTEPWAQSFSGPPERRVALGVFVVAIGNTPAERDQIALEAEEAVMRAGIGDETVQASREPAKSGEGAKRIYALRTRYVTQYNVDAEAPDQILRNTHSG